MSQEQNQCKEMAYVTQRHTRWRKSYERSRLYKVQHNKQPVFGKKDPLIVVLLSAYAYIFLLSFGNIGKPPLLFIMSLVLKSSFREEKEKWVRAKYEQGNGTRAKSMQGNRLRDATSHKVAQKL